MTEPEDEEVQSKRAAKREEKRKLRRENELADVRTLMGSPAGRRFLTRLLGQTRAWKLAWEADDRGTYYALGEQSVGFWLLEELRQADKRLALEMLMEKEAREETKDE